MQRWFRKPTQPHAQDENALKAERKRLNDMKVQTLRKEIEKYAALEDSLRKSVKTANKASVIKILLDLFVLHRQNKTIGSFFWPAGRP